MITPPGSSLCFFFAEIQPESPLLCFEPFATHPTPHGWREANPPVLQQLLVLLEELFELSSYLPII